MIVQSATHQVTPKEKTSSPMNSIQFKPRSFWSLVLMLYYWAKGDSWERKPINKITWQICCIWLLGLMPKKHGIIHNDIQTWRWISRRCFSVSKTAFLWFKVLWHEVTHFTINFVHQFGSDLKHKPFLKRHASCNALFKLTACGYWKVAPGKRKISIVCIFVPSRFHAVSL